MVCTSVAASSLLSSTRSIIIKTSFVETSIIFDSCENGISSSVHQNIENKTAVESIHASMHCIGAILFWYLCSCFQKEGTEDGQYGKQ